MVYSHIFDFDAIFDLMFQTANTRCLSNVSWMMPTRKSDGQVSQESRKYGFNEKAGLVVLESKKASERLSCKCPSIQIYSGLFADSKRSEVTIHPIHPIHPIHHLQISSISSPQPPSRPSVSETKGHCQHMSTCCLKLVHASK